VVKTSVREVLMQLGFDGDSVFREEEGMDVEAERHGRTSQFVHSVEWLEATG
jgi:hypothetical protein